MIVKFKGSDGLDERISQGSMELRQGMEYRVIQIYTRAGGAIEYRIHYSDIELPALFDSRLFEIVSGRIPRGWQVSRRWSHILVFGPEEWHRPGFWEAFMDHEEWAVEIYDAERLKMLGEPG